jgi:hypothetical protein
MCKLYKVYTDDRAWKAIGVRIQAPNYLSRVNQCWKIRARELRTDIRKYFFVNRVITDKNKLPEVAIRTSHGKMRIFKMSVRKVKTSEGK